MNYKHRLLRYTVIDQYKPRKDALIFLFFMGLILTALFAFVAIGKAQTVKEPVKAVTTQEGAFSEPADPCGLTDVVCANEPKILYAEVSAYTKVETCPDRECVTADGTKPVAFRTAACPRSESLGSTFGVFIRGQSYEFRCTDRTNERVNGRYDLYFGDTEEAYQEALAFGVQILPVVIK